MIDLRGSSATMENLLRICSGPANRLKETVQTAAHIRLHDTQIYGRQYKLLVVEDGIKEMIDVSNFQVYTSYHVTIAQTILSRLQTGTVSIENNIDKIFEYLRIPKLLDTSSSFEKIIFENRRSHAYQP